jgi:uncharacterized membrane protein
MVLLDSVWLDTLAKSVQQQGVTYALHLRPNIPVAASFYVVFAFGLMLFAVIPHESTAEWGGTLVTAALIGLLVYGTYDLTLEAALKNSSVGVSLVEMMWGAVMSSISAAAGKAALDRFASE